jgi:hypothetical protein
MRAWLAVALEESVRKRAVKMMVVVGSILAAINHGDALLAGSMAATEWMKVALTFVVPYCVSTVASVQAIRHGAAHGK